MTSLDYGQAQSAVCQKLRIARSPATLLGAWRAFVSECEECYRWDVSEYSNEILVRDQLAKILSAPELQHFAEHQALGEGVSEVDERFRTLLIPDVSISQKDDWWRAGILRRAGRDYAEYIRNAFGVEVAICGD